MNYIAEIEDKILEALSGLKTPTGYAKTLESYQGTLEEALEAPDKILVLLPAILVVFAGSSYKEIPVRVFQQQIRFRILVASGTLRGDRERRRGSKTPGQIGTYQMLTDVRQSLAGNTLDNTAAPISVVREEPVFIGKTRGPKTRSRFVSIYSALYQTELDYSAI